MIATLDEARAAAERLRPIRKPLTQGQCMPVAAAALLRQPLDRVPARLENQSWREWADEVEAAFEVKLRILSAREVPPPGAQPWIAVFDWGATSHAEFAIGARPAAVCGIVLDPDGPA